MTVFCERASELQAALVAEEDVYEDDVGTPGVDFTKRFGPRGGDAGHLDSLPLEEDTGCLQELLVVVDDQAADRHHLSVAAIS